tara:strand:- start:3102 stop:3608 length:507 start_codon:yes stop_codon:yes gene_type:complete
MQKPKLSDEEWKILASRLETQGWLEDMYDPKTGKRHWRGTKWGERHYQKACMLTDVNKLFSGNTLKQLEKANLGFSDLGDKELYKLGLIKEVFDDETFHDTKALTREGYEWLYAYTKLKGKKLTKYQAKGQITRSIEATMQVIFLMFALIAKNLTDGLAKKEKRKRRR